MGSYGKPWSRYQRFSVLHPPHQGSLARWKTCSIRQSHQRICKFQFHVLYTNNITSNPEPTQVIFRSVTLLKMCKCLTIAAERLCTPSSPAPISHTFTVSHKQLNPRETKVVNHAVLKLSLTSRLMMELFYHFTGCS